MSGTRQFKAGEKIIAEGTFGTETFRIQQGEVLICKETGKKTPMVLAELHSGEVFGEMYVFENSGFRSASAIAKTDVAVEVIGRDEIVKQLEATPPVIRDILMSLNKRLEGTSQDFSLASLKKSAWEKSLNKTIVVLLVAILMIQLLQSLQH